MPNASQRRIRPRSLIGARQQLPALPAVVERDRQVLQLRVEGVAHRRLDVGAGRQHEPAARQISPASSTPSTSTISAAGQIWRAVAGRQRAVDEALQHERDGERDERGEERRDHAEHDPGQGGTDEGIEPRDGADGSAGVRLRVAGGGVRHGSFLVRADANASRSDGWWVCGRGRRGRKGGALTSPEGRRRARATGPSSSVRCSTSRPPRSLCPAHRRAAFQTRPALGAETSNEPVSVHSYARPMHRP